MKFLLEGKEWPGPAQTTAAPVEQGNASTADLDRVLTVLPAQPRYLGESEDFGVRLLGIKNELFEGGIQMAYIVEHKKHGVVAFQINLLSAALEAMSQAQAELDRVMGKSVVKQ